MYTQKQKKYVAGATLLRHKNVPEHILITVFARFKLKSHGMIHSFISHKEMEENYVQQS